MKRITSFMLIILILLISFTNIGYTNQLSTEVEVSEEATDEASNDLNELSIEEKQILESLFILLQEIMEMEEMERVTGVQIDDLKNDIKDIEIKIEEETKKYENNLDIMEEVLRTYQKNGANSYIELILSSDSLGTLLKRLNAIRDISRNTNNLLETLEASKERMIFEKQNIANTLLLIEEKQKELREALAMKLELRDELELSLEELQDERLKYEEYLSRLENSFKDIKPVFSETINTLVRRIEEGYLPEDTVSISLSLPHIKGIIYENVFREVLTAQNLPAKLDITLSDDMMELIMPEIYIHMRGSLEILNEQALIFRVTEGKYMGLNLEPSAMEELFKNGYLELNFKQLLNKNKIKSVMILDDRIELLITPVLF